VNAVNAVKSLSTKITMIHEKKGHEDQLRIKNREMRIIKLLMTIHGNFTAEA
jgi:hypothetical protein